MYFGVGRGPQNHSLEGGGGGQKDPSLVVVVGRGHKFIFLSCNECSLTKSLKLFGRLYIQKYIL